MCFNCVGMHAGLFYAMGDMGSMEPIAPDAATQWLVIAVTLITCLVLSVSLAIIWWVKFSKRDELKRYGIPAILIAGIGSQTIGAAIFFF